MTEQTDPAARLMRNMMAAMLRKHGPFSCSGDELNDDGCLLFDHDTETDVSTVTLYDTGHDAQVAMDNLNAERAMPKT